MGSDFNCLPVDCSDEHLILKHKKITSCLQTQAGSFRFLVTASLATLSFSYRTDVYGAYLYTIESATLGGLLLMFGDVESIELVCSLDAGYLRVLYISPRSLCT